METSILRIIIFISTILLLSCSTADDSNIVCIEDYVTILNNCDTAITVEYDNLGSDDLLDYLIDIDFCKTTEKSISIQSGAERTIEVYFGYCKGDEFEVYGPDGCDLFTGMAYLTILYENKTKELRIDFDRISELSIDEAFFD